MVSTTQEQQPDGKLDIIWLTGIKAKEDESGKKKNNETMTICQQVSEKPNFKTFREMEIRSHMHRSPSDRRMHVTARLKTTSQKESGMYRVVHLYRNGGFRIFPVRNEADDAKQKELKKQKRRKKQERQKSLKR